MQLPFVGETYGGRSTDFDSSRSINFYPEYAISKDAKAANMLVGTPGTKLFSEFGDREIRLVYNFAGNCIVVAGNNIYEVYSDGAQSLPIASLPDETGYIVAADNGVQAYGVGGNQMLMITNEKGYIFDYVKRTCKEITATTFPLYPSTVTFLDGYFIVTDDSQGVYVSELYDGTVWPALATAAAISSPEPVQRAIAVNQQLIIIKQRATEVWANVATPTFQGCPFARMQGGVFAFGTPAPRSVCIGLDTVFFLANQCGVGTGEFVGVAMLNGFSPNIISTPSINYKISRMSNITSAFAYFYCDEGHAFYVITFPDDDSTLVYDVTLKQWHERSTSVDDTYEVHRHLANGYTRVFEKHLVGDYRGNSLLEMSSDYYDDNGTPIVSTRTAQIINDKQDSDIVYINRLIVDAETGVGDGSVVPSQPYCAWIADGSHYADATGFAGLCPTYDDDGNLISLPLELSHNGNPHAYLSWSNDSGHTWSAEYPAELGKQGEYGRRLSWRRLGKARSRVFRIRIADSVKKVLISASVQDELQ